MKKLFIISPLFLLILIQQVGAQTINTCNDFGHFDLLIDVVPPASDGASFVIDSAGDFPVEAGTGNTIVSGDLGDFPGGIHKTDDPGWLVAPDNMDDNEILWFRALGSLRYWDNDRQQWLNTPPDNERVRYFGATPPNVVINGTAEEKAFYADGTIWSSGGLVGPLEAPIEAFISGIHAHLDFCLEASEGDCTQPGSSATGSPSTGAYLIELQLFSKEVAANGTQQKYIDSPPVKVILNNGLVANECSAAIGALVLPETVIDDSTPLPAAGILIMTGP
jgi:hypothetical protein